MASDLILSIGYGTPGQFSAEREGVRSIKKTPKFFHQSEEKITAVIFINAIIWVDPFLFYILEISEDKKCIVFRRTIAYIVCALLTIFDFLYVLCYGRRLLELCRDVKIRCIWLFGIFFILPIPLVMMVSLPFQRKFSWSFWILEIVLILQHVSRFLQLMYTWGRRTTVHRESFFRWALMFLFLYISASHLFAGLWYNGAIYTETKCWEEAFRQHNRRSIDIFNCDHNPKEIKLLTDFCSGNSSNYDFGIFLKPHESGMLQTGRYYYEKMMFFFTWSLQNMSSFGQNFQEVKQLEGNMMTVFIIYTGVLLFFFLVGKMQLSLQAEDKGLAKRRRKLQETKLWKPFKHLPEDLKSQVKKHHNHYGALEEIKAINIEIIFNGLSENLIGKMTYELCKDQFKKVQQFKELSEAQMKVLCKYVKPVFFPRCSRIIREGDPIDEMIFVVKGGLWSYTSRSDGGDKGNEYWNDGDLCGKELVDWLQAYPYKSVLPISTKTIQAVSDVDAFSIMAHDLKLFHLYLSKRLLI